MEVSLLREGFRRFVELFGKVTFGVIILCRRCETLEAAAAFSLPLIWRSIKLDILFDTELLWWFAAITTVSGSSGEEAEFSLVGEVGEFTSDGSSSIDFCAGGDLGFGICCG